MMLSEIAPVASALLPIDEFADHLHLGSGFSDDGSQDLMLETFFRAAVAAVEARIGKALFQRDFAFELTRWRDGWRETLPIAPVSAIVDVKNINSDDSETVFPLEGFRLITDAQRPRLESAAGGFPSIPLGGRVSVRFTAGYGADWNSVPVVLRHATLLLAAHYYENRAALSTDHTLMPFGVLALLDSHRDLRIGGVSA